MTTLLIPLIASGLGLPAALPFEFQTTTRHEPGSQEPKLHVVQGEIVDPNRLVTARYYPESAPDIAGTWEGKLGPYAVTCLIWQSGPLLIWNMRGLGETGVALMQKQASGLSLEGEWSSLAFGAGEGSASLTLEGQLVTRIAWSHGITLARAASPGRPDLEQDAKPVPVDLNGEWTLTTRNGAEQVLTFRQMGPRILWHCDSLKVNGAGFLAQGPDGRLSAQGVEFQGDQKKKVELSAVPAAGGDVMIRWPDSATARRRAPLLENLPLLIGAAGAASTAQPSTTATPTSPATSVKPVPDSGQAPAREGPGLPAPIFAYRGQVMNLRNSLFTRHLSVAEIQRPFEIAQYWVEDPGKVPAGLEAVFAWWEVTAPIVGSGQALATDLNQLPPGVVFGFREFPEDGGHSPSGIKWEYSLKGSGSDHIAFVGDAEVHIDYYHVGASPSGRSPIKAWALGRGHHDVSALTGYRVEGIGGGEYTWLESRGPSSMDWTVMRQNIARLPVGTVVGLKHSQQQPGKVLIWNGQIYDPVKTQPVPEGFYRVVGGDAGSIEVSPQAAEAIRQGSKVGFGDTAGFYWYERASWN